MMNYENADINIVMKTLGFAEVEEQITLFSQKKCQAVDALFKAGFKHKKQFDPIIYNETIASSIILLSELKFTTFYEKALLSYTFASGLIDIFKQSYMHEVSEEMLESKVAFEALLLIVRSDNSSENLNEKFEAFKILFSEGFLTDSFMSNSHFLGSMAADKFYITVNLIKKHNLTKYLKVLVDTPQICYKFYDFLTKEMNSQQAFNLCDILERVPSIDRLNFLCDVVGSDNLKIIHTEKFCWNSIKSKLENNDDKQALCKLVYSDEDFVAKKKLKNIKETIKTTPWTFGFFDLKQQLRIGEKDIAVPQSVGEQIRWVWDTSSREISNVKKLNKVITLGKNEAQIRGDKLTPIKHLVVGKSETAKYFDYFVTEEAFENKFGLKS